MNISEAANEIKLKDVRSMLRWNAFSSRRDKALNAFIIGSVAKGTATEDSDIDIAVIIPELNKSALKITEHYHSKFQKNMQMPSFNGYRVDLQFFYEGSKELEEYSKIQIK